MTVAILAAAAIAPAPGAPHTVDDAAVAAVPVRARKTMSRGALLATAAMDALVRSLPHGGLALAALRDAACFVGVGASGGSIGELHAMLRASMDGARWSLTRFGGPGLAACNPLLAFQLMNNFTMAHAAIHAGVGTGPCGALFSRGAGTVHALAEAIAAVEDGDAAVAIAGGADSAHHPVTLDELRRGGWDGAPGEGAAMLAIGRGPGPRIVRCEIVAADAPLPDGPLVVIADAALRARLDARAEGRRELLEVLDAGAATGECLAAGPALAWHAALAVVARAGRATVVTADVDGALGVVALEAA